MKRWVIVETHKNKSKTLVSDLTESGDNEILFNDEKRAFDIAERLSKVRIENRFRVVVLVIN